MVRTVPSNLVSGPLLTSVILKCFLVRLRTTTSSSVATAPGAATPELPALPATACAALDTTSARRLAIKQRVLGLPTLAVYKDGEKIDEVTKDDATIENVEALIKKYI